MDPVIGGSDTQLVNSIFFKLDAEVILSIPVKEDMEDTWAYHFNARGCFSVKSICNLLRQLDKIERGEDGT